MRRINLLHAHDFATVFPCIKIDIPILAPGQTWYSKQDNITYIEMHFTDEQFKEAITDAVRNKEWFIVLVVEDIFEKKHTTYIKPNQQLNRVDVNFNVQVGDPCRALCNCMR